MKAWPPFALAAVFAVGAPVSTAGATPPVAIDAGPDVVSDYRLPAVSLSYQPAFRAGVTASLPDGAYGYAGSPTVEENGAGPDGRGAGIEGDAVAGRAGYVDGLDVGAALKTDLRACYEDGPFARTGKWDRADEASRTFRRLAAGPACVDSRDSTSTGSLVGSFSAGV